MTVSSRMAVSLSALLAFALPLAAQGGPTRPALDDLVQRVALAEPDEGNALRTHPATALPHAEGRLARAWVRLADAERDTGYARLADLADEFGRLVEHHPDWGLANLGLARTALLMHGRRVATSPIFAGALRGRHYVGYSFHLTRATENAVQLGAGMGFIADRLVREGERLQPAEVMENVRVLAERREADARLDLVLARDVRARGDATGAVAHLDRYLARGGDAAVGRLERARSLALLGSWDLAVHDYHAGLAAVTAEAGRAAYRADLAWVASRREMAAFDSLPPDSVAPWIERFWALRDARDFRDRDERLQEHLRRWNVVHGAFRVFLADRREHTTSLFITSAYTGQACMTGPLSLDDILPADPSRPDDARGPERVLDHRAVLYMRHGEPVRRVWNTGSSVIGDEFFGGSLERSLTLRVAEPMSADLAQSVNVPARDGTPVETAIGRPTAPARGTDRLAGAAGPSAARDELWMYLIDGVPRFYFLSPSMALGAQAPSTLFTAVVPDRFALALILQGLPLPFGERNDALLDAASGRSQLLLSGVTGSSWFCSPHGQTWLGTVQDDAIVAAGSDGFARRFDAMVAGTARAYALGRPGEGTGQLVLAVGVETGSLRPLAADGPDARRFAATLEVATLDPATAGSARRAAEVRFTPIGGASEAAVVALMPLAPGHREVRVLLHQGDARGALYAAEVSPAGAGLALSDIVVGAEGLPTVELGGHRVHVSPSGAFRSGAALTLYYELYGATPGGTYRSHLTMRRLVGGAPDAVSLTFSDRADAPTLAVERSLTLPDIPRGEYELELRVSQGEATPAAVRTQRIFIVAR